MTLSKGCTLCRQKRTRPSSVAGSEFWGKDFKPTVIDELAAPDMRFEYSLHAPRRGRDEVREFAKTFRAAFPDLQFWGTADLIAEGDYVIGQWEGGGTHTGDAFDDLPVGALPANTGRTMRFTGTSVLKIENGLITEEVGLDDGVTALQQLGLLKGGMTVEDKGQRSEPPGAADGLADQAVPAQGRANGSASLPRRSGRAP